MSSEREISDSTREIVRNAAIEAVKDDRVDDFARLFRQYPTIITSEDTAFANLATQSMSVPIFQVLLDNGWDINQPESRLEPPFMGKIIQNGANEDIIRWFLDHGADPNAYSSLRAVTPLSRAVQFAPLTIVNLLFEYGGLADRGELLNFACKRKAEDRDTLRIIQLLLGKGAPVNNLLFEGKPDLYDVTMFNGTPLWNCCISGNTDAVRLLLQHGANPRKKPFVSEDFPIDVARNKGYQEIVGLLSEAMKSSSRL